MSEPDVLVMRQKIHGMPAPALADAIRERLPDRTVVRATTPAEEREYLRTATVATGFRVDREVLPEARNLELFACVFAGADHLDLDRYREAGVAVTTASGVHGPNMAEHVLGAMLAFARGFDRAWRRGERREWRSFQTAELAGSTVAVVGLGAIGETVVDRLAPFDVETIGVRYSPEKGGPTDAVVGFDRVHEALAPADYVVLACPLTDVTEGLLDRDAFLTMPPAAVVINVARGPVVDTDALLWALRNNAVRGAALDVTDPEPLPPDHPLWTFDNVLITPHNAGHTPEYWNRVADILARNLERAAERGRYEGLENQVV